MQHYRPVHGAELFRDKFLEELYKHAYAKKHRNFFLILPSQSSQRTGCEEKMPGLLTAAECSHTCPRKTSNLNSSSLAGLLQPFSLDSEAAVDDISMSFVNLIRLIRTGEWHEGGFLDDSEATASGTQESSSKASLLAALEGSDLDARCSRPGGGAIQLWNSSSAG